MLRIAFLLPLLLSSFLPERQGVGTARVNAAAGEPYELGPGIIPPTRIATPSPAYTKEALDAGISGTVLLSVWVEKDGGFSHVNVIRGLGHGLDEAAQQTVSRWIYKPATKDGEPVTVHAVIKVHFKQRLMLHAIQRKLKPV